MHAKDTAELSADGLVFTELPNGEAAWLKPEHHTPRVVGELGSAHWPLDVRIDITDRGRDVLALERDLANCFGLWPTVAEACGLTKREQVA
jgi:hypothetical protein